MIGKCFFTATFVLLLSACGPGDEIDATNGDTLRESLNRIAEDMPEASRQSFGRDVLLTVEFARDGVDGIGRRDLYSNDYTMLFVSDEQAGIFSTFAIAGFEQMVLQAGSALDGKSPAHLARDAKEIRSAYFSSFAEEIQTANTELRAALNEIPVKIAAHQDLYEKTSAHIDNLEIQRASAIDNVRIVNISYTRNGYWVFIQGITDVTNYHSDPIKEVSFRLNFPLLPEVRGHYLRADFALSFDEPIPTGETRTALSFEKEISLDMLSVYREQGAEPVSFASLYGNIDLGPPEVDFRSYDRHYPSINLQPTRDDLRLVDGHDAQLEACEQEKTQFEEAIATNDALLIQIQLLVEEPAPFDGEIASPLRGTFGFYSRC